MELCAGYSDDLSARNGGSGCGFREAAISAKLVNKNFCRYRAIELFGGFGGLAAFATIPNNIAALKATAAPPQFERFGRPSSAPAISAYLHTIAFGKCSVLGCATGTRRQKWAYDNRNRSAVALSSVCNLRSLVAGTQ
jgi:hypothetical protein